MSRSYERTEVQCTLTYHIKSYNIILNLMYILNVYTDYLHVVQGTTYHVPKGALCNTQIKDLCMARFFFSFNSHTVLYDTVCIT